MFVRLVSCKTHASAHGVFHSGVTNEVSDDKGEALLELTSEAGDQYFVEVSEPTTQERVVVVVAEEDDETTKPRKVMHVGGNKKNQTKVLIETAEDVPVDGADPENVTV